MSPSAPSGDADFHILAAKAHFVPHCCRVGVSQHAAPLQVGFVPEMTSLAVIDSAVGAKVELWLSVLCDDGLRCDGLAVALRAIGRKR